uniref:Aminotransferase-like plant mobile domain-containing protein n=1 Tax=Fagus sylvatica TaxID=28930 RepID=A0A2N9GQ61_FAGSY
MSGQGSGSGGQRRSDRLAKGKAVTYVPESSPDTDDEYDAMEDVRIRVDSAITRNLQVELDAEAAGLASGATRPPSRPGVTIGGRARPSGTPRRPTTRSTGAPPTRLKRQRADRTPLSTDPVPEDYDPPESVGRGGWFDFGRLLSVSRREYSDFLIELGFSPFLGIPYVQTGVPFWASALRVGLPLEPISGPEALEILGIDNPDAIDSTRLPSLKVYYLADVLRRDRDEPSTELRYRQWTAYFIFSCFLGNDKSTVPTPLVGMFRDVDALREYDWGALIYGFYIRGLRRFSRRESISFLGFWQFTIFWAFEHFPSFAPSRLPLASDPDFPLARHWNSARIQKLTTRTLLECRTTVDCIRDADIVFQPYFSALIQRLEVFRAVELSHQRIWIRSPRSWELLMAERTMRQLDGKAVVPVDPPQLMTIESYIPRAPSDSYVAGVVTYPGLVRADVLYQEWFKQVSLGSLMSVHEVEGGRVMGGTAMESHLFRSSGEVDSQGGSTSGGDSPYADGGDSATGRDDPDAGGLGPAAEGRGFSGYGASHSYCEHSEIRGPAFECGHCSSYRS